MLKGWALSLARFKLTRVGRSRTGSTNYLPNETNRASRLNAFFCLDTTPSRGVESLFIAKKNPHNPQSNVEGVSQKTHLPEEERVETEMNEVDEEEKESQQQVSRLRV